MEMLDIEVFEGGFKETELGALPEEWEVVRLGEVVKIIKGKKPKILSKNPSKNSLPYLTAEYFRHRVPKQFVDIEVEKDLPICKKEDVILIWDGSAGQVFSGFEGVLASTMVKVIPIINNLNKSYLYYFLITKSNYLNSQKTGSVIPHINKTVFFNLPLLLPPLEEQKAIAGILSTVQSAIEKTEKVINALKNLKKSMMKHLFTYGPVAEQEAEKMELKETEIGLIPKHWEVVRVGEVVKIIKGKKPRTLNENPSKNSLPYLTAEYFRYGVPKQFVDIEVEKDLPICKKEDVVLIWDGSKAGQVFTGLEGVLASTMVKIIPTINNLDKLYLYCFLATKFDYLNSQTTGSTIPHVNKTVFFNLPLPLPPLEEQQKIAQILQSIDQRIEKEEKYKNALQNLFKSLLHNLMTGKIRVRVKDHGED
jgi:type I restriction enzyme S subunit